MKLRNKKTGEIADLSEGFIKDTYCGERIMIKPVAISNKEGYVYESLAKLNEEWEDYEEPKEYYFIRDDGSGVGYSPIGNSTVAKRREQIGNYFGTPEEAEKAVEKLKAWKLLKDECDFKFDGIITDDKAMLKSVKVSYDRHQVTFERMQECVNALHMLFGGKE